MNTTARQQLLRDGYCVLPGIADARLLEHLRGVAARLLTQQTNPLDTVFWDPRDPACRKLAVWQPSLTALANLGWKDVRYYTGYFINKKAGEARRPWHQDWWLWTDPISHGEAPPQLGLMYYLTDTTPTNGCLRVIPGSHRAKHPIHDHYQDGNWTMADARDEIAIPITAGDLLVMDARLLHASHANTTAGNRPSVTLWYLPEFGSLPPGARAWVSLHTSGFKCALPEHLRPVYDAALPTCVMTEQYLPKLRE
jgi:hypothetical protein